MDWSMHEATLWLLYSHEELGCIVYDERISIKKIRF